MSFPHFPHVHYYLICLVRVEGEVVVLTPCHKTGHLSPRPLHPPPVIRPITAVSSANITMMLSLCHTVMCEQCVEDGTENIPMWGANVCYDSV